MSKLFDQLKDASREREGGLIMGALAKKRADEAAAAAGAAAPRAEPAPASPAAASAPAEAAATPSAPTSASGSPRGGIALAAAIFGIAVLAWHSAPWRAPQKLKIDPGELKLDRKLDLERPSPRGTAPVSRPS